MVLMMHVLCLLSFCVENEFGGNVVSLCSAAEVWEQRSGAEKNRAPEPSPRHRWRWMQTISAIAHAQKCLWILH
ncbi:unnamed protein product [Knipowitschia caucasica]